MPASINPRKNAPVISIGNAEGTNTATINGSGTATIPTLAGGVQPKFIYVAIGGGLATNSVSIAPGTISVFSGTGFRLDSSTNSSVILNVHGYTTLSWAEIGDGTSTLYIYPLSDF